LDLLGYLIIGMGNLLLAQASGPDTPADSRPAAATAPAAVREKGAPTDRSPPWYIILDAPRDMEALWQRIEHPDLILMKADQLPGKEGRVGTRGNGVEAARSLVESVQVRGRVMEDFAKLTIDLLIVVKGAESVWAPIRLDGQSSLLRAREGALDLGLRRVESGQWQVKLGGDGGHRIQVELTVPLIMAPARNSLSLAIPEAASTSVDLDFSHGESDIIVGENEVLGPPEPGNGKETHLTAHLSPRSRLDVSWTSDADAGARGSPLLTAKGEIAIEIDEEQVRTRSSWAVRCVRGTIRSLEMRLDDDDAVTEFQLDDQSAEAQIERVRGTGKLTIRLLDPLRVSAAKRLVMKTRRTFSNGGARRILFTGFSLLNAREQTGFIGITQSANLFVKPSTSRGLRPVAADKLPADLRTRPSTSLAFEFLDQRFLLDLEVESSPPLVKEDSKTLFRIGADRARSETTIAFDCARGQISELELAVAPGLELISVGPPEVVESSHLSDEILVPPSRAPNSPARLLKVRLTTLGRESNEVTLVLTGLQRIASDAREVKFGLFAPMQVAAASSSYALVAERGLSLDLDGDSGPIRRVRDPSVVASGRKMGWPWTALRGEPGATPLLLVDDGNSRYLPIRIARHARTIAQDTVLSAQVSRRWVDLLGRATLAW
jgi:hypothetical protein